LINPSNLKPAERLEEIARIYYCEGHISLIFYFLNELANNAKYANFDDKCYWKDVEDEFKSRLKNGR
jgi:hypothetical protein